MKNIIVAALAMVYMPFLFAADPKKEAAAQAAGASAAAAPVLGVTDEQIQKTFDHLQHLMQQGWAPTVHTIGRVRANVFEQTGVVPSDQSIYLAAAQRQEALADDSNFNKSDETSQAIVDVQKEYKKAADFYRKQAAQAAQDAARAAAHAKRVSTTHAGADKKQLADGKVSKLNAQGLSSRTLQPSNSSGKLVALYKSAPAKQSGCCSWWCWGKK